MVGFSPLNIFKIDDIKSLYNNSNIWAFQEQFLLIILFLVCELYETCKDIGQWLNCGNSGNWIFPYS